MLKKCRKIKSPLFKTIQAEVVPKNPLSHPFYFTVNLYPFASPYRAPLNHRRAHQQLGGGAARPALAGGARAAAPAAAERAQPRRARALPPAQPVHARGALEP